MSEEGLQDTPNKLIHIGRPIEFDEEEFCRQLVHLYQVANSDSEMIRQEVKKIVPTYHYEGEDLADESRTESKPLQEAACTFVPEPGEMEEEEAFPHLEALQEKLKTAHSRIS